MHLQLRVLSMRRLTNNQDLIGLMQQFTKILFSLNNAIAQNQSSKYLIILWAFCILPKKVVL